MPQHASHVVAYHDFWHAFYAGRIAAEAIHPNHRDRTRQATRLDVLASRAAHHHLTATDLAYACSEDDDSAHPYRDLPRELAP